MRKQCILCEHFSWEECAHVRSHGGKDSGNNRIFINFEAFHNCHDFGLSKRPQKVSEDLVGKKVEIVAVRFFVDKKVCESRLKYIRRQGVITDISKKYNTVRVEFSKRDNDFYWSFFPFVRVL